MRPQGLAFHPVMKYKANQEMTGTEERIPFKSNWSRLSLPLAPSYAGKPSEKSTFVNNMGCWWSAFGGKKDDSRQLSRITLRPGDVLVLMGDEEAFPSPSGEPTAFLMLVPLGGERLRRDKASLVAGIV